MLDKCATGQESDNTIEKENHLLRCKQPVLASSFNVNTLNSKVKMGEITYCAEMEGIDVLCIQEHRIFHEEINIRHHKMGRGWMLLTSSAEKGSKNATIRGVVGRGWMLLTSSAEKGSKNATIRGVVGRGWMLLTSSAEKGSKNATIRGVVG